MKCLDIVTAKLENKLESICKKILDKSSIGFEIEPLSEKSIEKTRKKLNIIGSIIFLASLVSRHYDRFKYIFLHETGELNYLLPLMPSAENATEIGRKSLELLCRGSYTARNCRKALLYSLDALDGQKDDRLKTQVCMIFDKKEYGLKIYRDIIYLIKRKDIKEAPSMSEISPSDIYGDLLASTFSPLSPHEQLYLIKERKLPRTDITHQQKNFLREQLYHYVEYSKRTDSKKDQLVQDLQLNYSHGPELRGFYLKILELQIGFTPKQRKYFQLRLYDTVQKMISENIKKLGKCTEQNISEIIFDPEYLINQLKKQVT